MQFFNRGLFLSILFIGLTSPLAIASSPPISAEMILSRRPVTLNPPSITRTETPPRAGLSIISIFPANIWALIRTLLYDGDILRLVYGLIQSAEANGEIANAQNSSQLFSVIQNIFRESAQTTINDPPNGSIRRINNLGIPERLGALLNQYRRINRLNDAERANLVLESGRMMVRGADLSDLGRWTIEQLLLEDSQTEILMPDRADILTTLITNGYERNNLIRIYNFIIARWELVRKDSDPTWAQVHVRELTARLTVFMIQNHPQIELPLTELLVNDLLIAATSTQDEVLLKQAQLIQQTYIEISKAKKAKAEKNEADLYFSI